MENGNSSESDQADSTMNLNESLNLSQKSPVELETLNYSQRILQRNQALERLPLPIEPQSYYSVSACATVPMSTSIQALSIPPCTSNFYVGGSDGYIRKYNTHEMLNGTSFNENSHNLIMKFGLGIVPESKPPLLVGYWENEDMGTWAHDLSIREGDASKVKWGNKNSAIGDGLSIVHSLAVQSQELWGLSGTAHGTINLFSIRHDEGQIRHVFKSSGSPLNGHKANSPVSVLTLTADEKSVLSGGWDTSILQWDLNTGGVARTFAGHFAQISSVAFRPILPSVEKTATSPNIVPLTATSLPDQLPTKDRVDSLSPKSTDSLFNDNGSEKDADGDIDLSTIPKSTLPILPKRTSIAAYNHTKDFNNLSDEIFLSSSIDGEILLWDRRVKEGGKICKRLGAEGRTWCTSASWSANGDQIFVGRRNAAFDIFDLRNSSIAMSTHQLSSISGPITSIVSLDSTHLITASIDTLRLWDLTKVVGGENFKKGNLPWSIISGGQGGTISALHLDPTRKFLFSASGNRGWDGSASESLVVYDVTHKAIK